MPNASSLAGALAAPFECSVFVALADPAPSVLSWLGAGGLLAGEAAHGNAPVPIRGANGCYGWLRQEGEFFLETFCLGLGWCGGLGVALLPRAAAGCLGLPPALPLGFLWVVRGLVVCVAFAGLLACLPCDIGFH